MFLSQRQIGRFYIFKKNQSSWHRYLTRTTKLRNTVERLLYNFYQVFNLVIAHPHALANCIVLWCQKVCRAKMFVYHICKHPPLRACALSTLRMRRMRFISLAWIVATRVSEWRGGGFISSDDCSINLRRIAIFTAPVVADQRQVNKMCPLIGPDLLHYQLPMQLGGIGEEEGEGAFMRSDASKDGNRLNCYYRESGTSGSARST